MGGGFEGGRWGGGVGGGGVERQVLRCSRAVGDTTRLQRMVRKEDR